MFLKVLEFLPVIIFFICYKVSQNLILATSCIIVACLICSLINYLVTKSISRLQIFLIFAILIFGVPTILLKDPSIIKWKVTVVNALFAITIFVFQYILKKNPFSFILKKELPLPDKAFATLGTMWMVFFVLAGALNVVIAFYLPDLIGVTKSEAESLWVDYKTFGNPILNTIYALISGGVIIKKYPEILKDNNNQTSR